MVGTPRRAEGVGGGKPAPRRLGEEDDNEQGGGGRRGLEGNVNDNSCAGADGVARTQGRLASSRACVRGPKQTAVAHLR